MYIIYKKDFLLLKIIIYFLTAREKLFALDKWDIKCSV